MNIVRPTCSTCPERHFFFGANHGFHHPDDAGFQPHCAELAWPLATAFLQRTV